MKVAMYYNNSDIRVEDISVPEIGTGELLVKIMASGVCGSDVMEWYRIKKAPLVLGHEIAGTVEQVGVGVVKYKKGDRVFVSHHIPCNTCHYCLQNHHTACEILHTTNYDPGGFAEFVRIPQINVDRGVFVLPDYVSFEQAVFIEPLACVVRGQGIARLKPGQTVLVLGSGISGLLHIDTARACGAGTIIATDINNYRLDAAKQFGADVVVNAREDIAQRVKKANAGRLADLVIVCTGARSAFAQALASVGRGGTILFFAPTEPGVMLEVPVNDLWRNEITLVPSYGNAPKDAQIAIDLISSNRVNVKNMITHRLSLAGSQKAFSLVSEAQKSIKVIIYPHSKS